MSLNATEVGSWPTGSPEWHAARVGKMSGSRIAAVMGLSPYESRFSLWHRMNGDIGEPEMNDAMEWGNRLEAAVIAKFAEGVRPRDWHVDPTPCVWQNNDRPWQVATPDAAIITSPQGIGALLEVKTARYDDGWGPAGTDLIPIHYRCQVLWYLDTLGLDVAHVAVLIAGSDYREYVIELDAPARDDIRIMRQRARDFLDSLEAGQRPGLDGHDETYQAIRELHPDIEPSSVDVPDEVGARLITTKEALDAATAAHKWARSELADHMGSAHYAYWRGVKIADRRCKTAEGSVPYLQLVRTLPDLTLEQPA